MENDTAKTTPSLEIHDLAAAFGLLTRLPVPVDHGRAGARMAQAVWAYPVVGLVLGALSWGVIAGLAGLGVPPLVAALVGVMGLALVTGGLHEDGLADCADGLIGGATKARRLEIMRDSRVGSYGALALVFSVGIRAACLAALVGAGLWAMIAIAALSRGAMVAVAATLPDAREEGLGAGLDRMPRSALALCAVLSLGALAPLSVPTALAVLVAGAGATVALALSARRLIGGRTGDVLGASQQVCEMAALVTLTALWA